MKNLIILLIVFTGFVTEAIAQNAFNVAVLTNAAAATASGRTAPAGQQLVAITITANRKVPASGNGDWSGAGISNIYFRIPNTLTPTPLGGSNTTQVTSLVSGFAPLNFGDGLGNSPAITLITPSDAGGTDDGYVYFSVQNTAGQTNKTYANGFTSTLISFLMPDTWACASCLHLVTDNTNALAAASIDTSPTLNFSESGVTMNQFVVTQNDAPLPITLVDFTATKAGAKINLNWIVSSEINAKNYDVERSGNGTDFTAIATVPAINNTKYSSTDASPLGGVNYYRLKMIDIDGKFKYSEVRSVLFDGTTVLFDIYPNPVITNTLYLHIQQYNYAGKAQAVITDIAGRSIQSTNVNIIKGNNQLPVIIKTLKSGTYFVTVYDASGVVITESKKLVKL